MGDLISREAAIQAINAFDYRGLSLGDVRKVTDGCAVEVNKLPAVDAEPVRRGKWIERGYYDEDGYYSTYFVCSECGREEPYKEAYCHCGARMTKEEMNE